MVKEGSTADAVDAVSTKEQQVNAMKGSKDEIMDDPPTEDKEEEFTFDMSMKKKKKKKPAAIGTVPSAVNPTTLTLEEKLISADTMLTESSEATSIASTDKVMGKGTNAKDDSILPDADEVTFSTPTTVVHTDDISKQGTGAFSWSGTDRDYTYQELLGRVFSILRQNNPDLAGDRRKFTIIPPIIGRESSKKTAFANIAELCRRMRRPMEHVTQFLLTELGTTGNTDATQRLIIKGRFQQLQIENLLRRYIGEYVTCKTCRSPETQLVKENRLFFLKCDSCGSSRSVATIKAGFKAQTGRRIRAE